MSAPQEWEQEYPSPSILPRPSDGVSYSSTAILCSSSLFRVNAKQELADSPRLCFSAERIGF